MSDDMGMSAIVKHFGQREAIKLAINAGVDVLVFGNNNTNFDPNITEHTLTMIRDLVMKGEIKEARINDASERISKLKERLP